MEDWLTSADEAVRFIRDRWPGCHPAAAIVLGSGLGGFAESLENPEVIDASSVPHWPVSTVAGHQGRLVLGEAFGKQVLALQGRIHYYEGYSIQQVSFPVRVLGRLGVGRLILTNAAGGIRPDLAPGELMLITDHINFMGTNPLIGPNESAFGERFPDMSSVYDPEWTEGAWIAADEAGIPLKKGILAVTPGPCYETPAEVEMLRRLGADAVCMSTVPEAIAAAHMGIRVLGISCVANAAGGLSPIKLSHEDVTRNVSSSQALFNRLIAGILRRLET
jgi:purine-nucleoside phosphorylase